MQLPVNVSREHLHKNSSLQVGGDVHLGGILSAYAPAFPPDIPAPGVDSFSVISWGLGGLGVRNGTFDTFNPPARGFGVTYPVNQNRVIIDRAVAARPLGPLASVNQGDHVDVDELAYFTGPGGPMVVAKINDTAVVPGGSVTLPSGATVLVNNDYSIRYTPSTGSYTTDSFTCTAADATNPHNAAVGSVNITVYRPPVVPSIDPQRIVAGANPTPITLNASSPNNDALWYDATGANWVSANAGVVTLAPASNEPAQDKTITVTVTDPTSGLSTSVTFAVHVYAVPVISDDYSTYARSGIPVTIDVPASARDPNGVAMTFAGVGTPAYGSAAINADHTAIVYTPGATFPTGGDSFSYTVTDRYGGLSTATMYVTFVNTSPTNLTLSNNSISLSADYASVIGKFSATDPDYGDLLSYQIISDPSGVFGIAQDNSGDLLYFNMNGAMVPAGSYTIVVQATDWYGNWDPNSTPAIGTFTIDIV